MPYTSEIEEAWLFIRAADARCRHGSPERFLAAVRFLMWERFKRAASAGSAARRAKPVNARGDSGAIVCPYCNAPVRLVAWWSHTCRPRRTSAQEARP